MKILTLDLGTNTGWAVLGNTVTSGTMSFKPNRYEGGGMRYLRFEKWLNEINGVHAIEQVYFEEVRRHAGVDASHVYGGFLATLTAWCEDKKIPYLGIPVGSIKKHITGKGNSAKQEVINSINAKNMVHYQVTDDNEADALALLHLVIYEEAKQ